MNALRFLAPLLFLAAPMLCSAIEVRVSVKFIRDSAGNPPTAAPGNIDISTQTLFDVEVAHGNVALELMARGYRVKVVEYLTIQPPAPQGQPANFWYDLDARTQRPAFEAAALADTATWRWNPNALNIYVNNTDSGSCSFPLNGQSITLGRMLFNRGTVIHEVGHFFDLHHTHGAPDNNGTVGDWLDGDGLNVTLPDDPDASLADINAQYPGETQKKRDDLFYNIMSYHDERFFLSAQMDIWTGVANGERQFICDGQTYFVAPFPFSNSDPQFNGASTFFPAFLERALALSGNAQDVLLFQRNYPIIIPGEHIVINQACIIAAPGEPITIGGDSF